MLAILEKTASESSVTARTNKPANAFNWALFYLRECCNSKLHGRAGVVLR